MIKLGLDLHTRQVNRVPAAGRFNTKACTKMGSLEVVESSRKWVKAGIKVYSCYEAAHCRLCSSVRRGVAVARLLPKTTAVISRRENVILIAFCKTVSLNHNPIYGSKEPFLMTNSIYLKPFDRVRSNHPFWA